MERPRTKPSEAASAPINKQEEDLKVKKVEIEVENVHGGSNGKDNEPEVEAQEQGAEPPLAIFKDER